MPVLIAFSGPVPVFAELLLFVSFLTPPLGSLVQRVFGSLLRPSSSQTLSIENAFLPGERFDL